MKAAVYRGPHDISIEDRPVPSLEGPDDVIVRVRRAAICGTDASEWDHGPMLARPPVTLGHEFMGEIVDVGPRMTDWRPGIRVVTGAGVWCGACEWCDAGRPNLCSAYETLGLQLDGGLAEFVRVPARTMRVVPEGVDDGGAALAQPLAVALHAVRRSRLSQGERCVILGVGGIGAFIVAAAVSTDAADVIAVDIDAHRLETARALGATTVIDASGEDLATVLRDSNESGEPDVIIEATGAPEAPAAAMSAVKRGGRVVLVGLQGGLRELNLFALSVREIEVLGTVAHVCDEDLPAALDVLSQRDLARFVVDRTLTLDELVPIGIQALVSRTATGKFLVDPTT